MIIKKLEKSHADALFPLFETHKYMGAKVDSADFFAKDAIAKVYHKGFCTTYLSGLNNYHAFGAFDGDNIVGAIACYQSTDEPSWYGTQIRSMNNKEVARNLLDHMIKFNEEVGRFKFYTLWNAKHAKLLRRFAFRDWADEDIVKLKFLAQVYFNWKFVTCPHPVSILNKLHDFCKFG
jgi:hypothetical protein